MTAFTLRCTDCAHFRRGTVPPQIDTLVQCTNPSAPLYQVSEDMQYASPCRLFKARSHP